MDTITYTTIRCPSCMGSGYITHLTNTSKDQTTCNLCLGMGQVTKEVITTYKPIVREPDEPQYTITDTHDL